GGHLRADAGRPKSHARKLRRRDIASEVRERGDGRADRVRAGPARRHELLHLHQVRRQRLDADARRLCQRVSRPEVMGLLAQALASGVVTGSVYALIALSLVMVYKSTDVINFAGGDLLMAGCYVALIV